MTVGIPYDSTEHPDAIDEVLTTLTETLLIVVVVIFQYRLMRALVIPVVAIPILLVGAVFLMFVAGFTINLLTPLAIVLSVGSRGGRCDRHGGERGEALARRQATGASRSRAAWSSSARSWR